jgi:Ca-activated chloride channel family protein
MKAILVRDGFFCFHSLQPVQKNIPHNLPFWITFVSGMRGHISFGNSVSGSWLCFFACLLLMPALTIAQEIPKFKPHVNRILFVLDVSGSMKEKWNGRIRYDIATELLGQLVDSVERTNPNVEFAVRVFGSQYPREKKICTDTRLLVPFAKDNAARIKEALKTIGPNGMTPIAYSLTQAAADFPKDERALNSVILITDGDENCSSDPCAASKALSSKRISLKPFIVGLNMESAITKKFECIGTFYNPKDAGAFSNTIGVIIKQTLNNTTVQVNLLDKKAEPAITNIPFTLYDHATGKILYNFVHGLDSRGNPDTLFLDPVGIYDIEVHTTPSVRKNDIELTPGKHNIIAVDVPMGNVAFTSSGSGTDALAVVREEGKKDIIRVLGIGQVSELLANKYRAEILTHPEILLDTAIIAGGLTDKKIPQAATFALQVTEPVAVSVLKQDKNGGLSLVLKRDLKLSESLFIQPGEYYIVYKAAKSNESAATKWIKVVAEDGRYISVNLN